MLLSCSNWTVPIIFDMDSILDRFRRDIMPLFSHMHGLVRNTFDIYLYPEVSRAIWEKKWWHFWPYWPVPSLMGSVLLRGEILKFFIKNHLGGGEPVFSRLGSKFLSTTISKDLDEVLTWESRYLGHLRPIITMMIIIYTNIDARWRQVYEGDDMVTKFPCRWKIDGYGSQGWELEAA